MSERRIALILDHEEYDTVISALKRYTSYEADGKAEKILSEVKKVKKAGGGVS